MATAMGEHDNRRRITQRELRDRIAVLEQAVVDLRALTDRQLERIRVLENAERHDHG